MGARNLIGPAQTFQLIGQGGRRELASAFHCAPSCAFWPVSGPLTPKCARSPEAGVAVTVPARMRDRMAGDWTIASVQELALHEPL